MLAMRKTLCFILLGAVGITSGLFLRPSNVCYESYGCFENIYNTKKLPETPEQIGLKLTLNNAANPAIANGEPLTPTDEDAIADSQYNNSLKLVLIIHGFHGCSSDEWVVDMAKEIIKADDINVICVGWEPGAATNDYGQATANTRLVGKMVSVLLENINLTQGTHFSDMHVIGHGLGAHIAGYAGSYLPEYIGRISGLDPAGLNFEHYAPLIRLDPTDALFVEVIHSDADALIEMGFGMGRPIGHVDFYPNGGENQPGCNNRVLSFFQKLIQGGYADRVICNHMRGTYLFISSISKCTFTGLQSNSYDDYRYGNRGSKPFPMGYWLPENYQEFTGKFYLQTTDTDPYC